MIMEKKFPVKYKQANDAWCERVFNKHLHDVKVGEMENALDIENRHFIQVLMNMKSKEGYCRSRQYNWVQCIGHLQTPQIL